MISALAIDVGDEVRDTQLGLTWTIVGRDGDGGILIRRNGVTASASIWDLDLSTGSADQKPDAQRVAPDR